jgi:hypothetical protein
MVEVFVPKLVKSLNRFKGRHWSYYNRIKRSWLSALTLILGRGEHHNVFQNVKITAYHESTRNFLDDDNFRGGCKPVIDCLKDLGWVKDDSLKWVKVKYEQKTRGEEGTHETGTRIQVRALINVMGPLCPSCTQLLLGPLQPFIVEQGTKEIKTLCCLCKKAEATCAVVVNVWRA